MTAMSVNRRLPPSQPALELEYELDDTAEPTYRVGELAAAIDHVLRRTFTDGVWVRGEIQGYRSDRNGHAWFRLCERTDESNASLDVVLFAGVAGRLRPLLRRHRLALEDGMQVRVFVEVDFYAPTGKLTLKMRGLDPMYTLGQLAADRERLLRRLVGEGLLDAQSRLPLPVCPYRVGLVTSVGSAAWHDLTHELQRSGFAWHVVVCDTSVQGAGAEDGIAAALRRVAAAGVDVVALVRGGGSRTDLAMFDAEVVARTIAGLGVPVVTGLGHEIDRAVADEVARLALKTPTAVAGWLIDQARAHHDATEAVWRAIARRADAHLQADNRELVAIGRRLSGRTQTVVGRAEERLVGHARRLGRTSRQVAADAGRHVERAAGRIEGAGRRHVDLGARQLDAAAVRLASRAPRSLADAERQLRTLDARRAALDPARTLARGWSITRTAGGRLVRSVADVADGDELLTTVSDGTTRSRVEGSSP